jgi:hypothetical protein
LESQDITFLENIFHEIQENIFSLLENSCIQKFLDSDLFKKSGHSHHRRNVGQKDARITDSLDNLDSYFAIKKRDS